MSSPLQLDDEATAFGPLEYARAVLNILVIGTVTDIALVLLPTPEADVVRIALFVFGVLLNGIAGAAYIGAGLGPGPRDGLMTGFCLRLGLPIKVVRTAIELAALGVGWTLGGTVGFGTVLYAISIGWVVHHALPIFTIGKPRGSAPAVPS